ncbi:unknow [Vibrio campbellii]|nr:unknow [Vibrio campbellii]
MGPNRYGHQANSCFYFQLFLKTEGKKSGKLFSVLNTFNSFLL